MSVTRRRKKSKQKCIIIILMIFWHILRFFYSITIEVGLDLYGNEGSFIYLHISQVTTGVCDLFSCVHYHNGSINFPLLINIHSYTFTWWYSIKIHAHCHNNTNENTSHVAQHFNFTKKKNKNILKLSIFKHVFMLKKWFSLYETDKAITIH